MKTKNLLTLLTVVVHTAGAAVIPYTNDFSGSGANTAFPVENTDAEWTVTGGSYVFSFTNTAITPSTASLPILGSASVPFTMETQFTVTSAGNFNGNGSTIGFGLFGLNTTFTGANSGSAYYLADFQVANTNTATVGTLRILSLGEATGFTGNPVIVDANLSVASLAIEVGATYTLRLEGTYAGSTLNMTLGLYNAAGTTQIGASATASDTSPLTGTNFGFRNRIGLGGGTFSTNFDNFQIVPEPASAALVLLGLAATGCARRRRK